MCSSPILIDNLNRGCRDPTTQYLKDCLSVKIAIPCGHCPSCLALKQNYFVQRMECESLDNHLWTGMLSYSNQMMPTAVINGYKHKFADTRDIQLLLRRLRNDEIFPKGFRYWFVSERGFQKHRPHWHFMISTPKKYLPTISHVYDAEKYYHDSILERWYTNIGSKRKPIKIPNLIYYNKNGRRNYDFHWLNPNLTLTGCDDVAFYNSKYLLKDDDYTKRLKSALYFNCSDDAFKFFWQHLKNKTLSSHYLGDVNNPIVADYINFCIQFSYDNNFPFPCFVNPNDGSTFPLAPYLRSKFVSLQTALAFRDKHPELYQGNTGCHVCVDISVDKIVKQYDKFKHVLSCINARDVHADFHFDNTDLYNILDYGDNLQSPILAEISPDNWESDFFD